MSTRWYRYRASSLNGTTIVRLAHFDVKSAMHSFLVIHERHHQFNWIQFIKTRFYSLSKDHYLIYRSFFSRLSLMRLHSLVSSLLGFIDVSLVRIWVALNCLSNLPIFVVLSYSSSAWNGTWNEWSTVIYVPFTWLIHSITLCSVNWLID